MAKRKKLGVDGLSDVAWHRGSGKQPLSD